MRVITPTKETQMTTETQLRQAIREGTDWVRIARLLRRAGHVIAARKCPHCDAFDTGWGAWPDTMSTDEWLQLRDAGSGLPYVCRGDEREEGYWVSVGCGSLFVGRN